MPHLLGSQFFNHRVILLALQRVIVLKDAFDFVLFLLEPVLLDCKHKVFSKFFLQAFVFKHDGVLCFTLGHDLLVGLIASKVERSHELLVGSRKLRFVDTSIDG